MVSKCPSISILLPFALQKATHRTLFKPVEIHIKLLYGYFSAALIVLVG